MPHLSRSNTAVLIGSSSNNSSSSSGQGISNSNGLIHRSSSGIQGLSGSDLENDKLNNSNHKRVERSGSLLDTLPNAPVSSSFSNSSLDNGLGSTIDVQISSSTSAVGSNSNSSSSSGGSGGQAELSGLGASGLGAHIALVALSVFVAYLWMLGLKVVESSWSFLHQHSVLSSVRLFKVAMVAALLLVRLARPKLELRHTKVPPFLHKIGRVRQFVGCLYGLRLSRLVTTSLCC